MILKERNLLDNTENLRLAQKEKSYIVPSRLK